VAVYCKIGSGLVFLFPFPSVFQLKLITRLIYVFCKLFHLAYATETLQLQRVA